MAAVAGPSDMSQSSHGRDQWRLEVQDLTLLAPVKRLELQLALPVRVPRFIQRRIQKGEASVPKELVRRVNLRAEPGELVALIGGSGSGKTTLLSAIAGRLGDLLSEGAVNYQPLDEQSAKSARQVIGYVRQDDSGLLPYLTVRETLDFAAALRLPRSVDNARRRTIIDQTLLELGLRDVADVTVGGGFGKKGVSGGERRRLTIGCILVAVPSILVLDEPTTGLDSFTAHALLETLSALAKRGRVVVMSIHQPRSDVFPLLDKVVLLSSGSVVYAGHTSRMLPHFSSAGYTIPKHVNPLDFVIDSSSVDTRDDKSEETSRDRVGRLVLAWREKEAAAGQDVIWRRPSTAVQESARGHDDVEKAPLRPTVSRAASRSLADGATQRRPNIFAQARILTIRGLRNVLRNYGQVLGFFLQAVIIGVGIGLAFLRPPETPAGIQSLKTVIYMTTPACFYLSIVIFVYILCGELRVFDREREDNLYKTVPAVIGLFLTYFPVSIIFPALYAVIVYFMTNMWRQDLAVNVFSFIAECILQSLSAFTYALLAVSVNRSFASASLLANGFSIIFILSAGYLITELPVWIEWTKWLSPYFYGYNWIARLQFLGRTFECPNVTGPARNACDGRQVLVGLNFNLATPLWVFPVGLVGFIVMSLALATLLLAFYQPGGVKFANAQPPSKTKSSEQLEKQDAVKQRDGVDVVINRLSLIVAERTLSPFGSGRKKSILTGVDAEFPRGQVSVIMGPSGAGKSSLLQILAGRLDSNRFTSSGDVLLNGELLSSRTEALVAFVEQDDDHHLPALTVRETLRYAARLRIRDASSAECDARADELIRTLGLRPCANNVVGNELLKGISGGEKRRLSLAVELLSDPAVILADEPLSGLDAFTARNVMGLLSDLAASGRTVIVSVHQPRSDVWEMFDNVLLLAKGGITAFSGRRVDILEAFEQAGASCPPNFNPADFILDAISVDIRSESAEEKTKERVDRLLSQWQARQERSAPPSSSHSTRHGSEHLQSASFFNNAKQSLSRSPSPHQRPEKNSRTSSPFVTAFPVVLRRSIKNLVRLKDAFFARLFNPPFLALLFWIFFARLNYSPTSAQTRVGLLQETTALPFVGMLSCIAIFPTELALFTHEYKTSARQGVVTFLASYTAQETLSSIVSSLLWSIVFVYGMNLQHSARIFVEFWFSSYALLSFGESIGIIFCSWFSTGGIAVFLTSAGITLLSQLNGIISVTLPFFLEVIGWISPMKPQARVQIVNEMRGLVFDCTQEDIASGACIAETGEQLLSTFSIGPEDTGKFMGILMALIVLWRLFAVAALRARVATL